MSSQRRELQGWDEIAAYLGVRRRAAQNYEKEHGLPVRRLPGEKGRVWAYADEIDRWKELGMETSTARDDHDESDAADTVTTLPPGRTKFGWRWRAGAVLIAAGILGYGLWARIGRPQAPQDFRLERQHIVALDDHGGELWRFGFPEPLLRGLYPDKLTSRFVWTGNLDGDSDPETLFAYSPHNWQSAGSTLYCFSGTGTPKWEFKPGSRVVDASGAVYETFGAGPILTFSQSALHRARVLISSAHTLSYPGQLAILSAEGSVLGEYWHSGHLLRIAIADLDSDGVEEVLAGGVNNGYNRATLVVFDPRRMTGASTQRPGDPTQLQGFVPGTEKAVIWFPRSCITELDEPFNRVNMLSVTKSLVEVNISEAHHEGGAYLIYDFDHQLRPLRVTVSDKFLKRHRELELGGRLKHSFTTGEKEALLKGVEVIRD
ncbi:MAG: hypothetical protein SFV51_24920 [Bryobacteraceae bacterium]|nr:hypothetical protein [Bryobacteraceae bacterium]